MTNPFSELEDATTEEVVSVFIDHVTKTDEEIEEGEKKQKKSTELKIYLAENQGFNPGNLKQRVLELHQSKDTNKRPKEYFDNHNFEIQRLNSDTFHLVISTPKYERQDDFVLIDSDGYLKALTVIRKKWADNTIKRLIDYIPHLDRLFLSSNDLRSIIDTEDDRRWDGFTAKYNPFYKDERVSVQVHGGNQTHLNDVEEHLNARPKRVVFSQKNSPTEAVKGAVSQDGYASIPRVRHGSEDVGYETIKSIIENCQNRDRNNFAVPYRPERLTPREAITTEQDTLEESENGEATDGGVPDAIDQLEQGSVLEGWTICELEEEIPEDEYPDEQGIATLLEEDVLDYKRRYTYSVCGDGNFLVYDRNLGSSFEIIIADKNIRVYAKANTTPQCLRDFYEIIEEEFNSTYEIHHTSKKVRA
jgi:hypothetical protein